MSSIPSSTAASVVGSQAATQRSSEQRSRAERDQQRIADNPSFADTLDLIKGAEEDSGANPDAEGRGSLGRESSDEHPQDEQPRSPASSDASEQDDDEGLDLTA